MEPSKLFFYFNGFNAAILEDFSGSEKISATAEFAREHGYRFIPVSTCYRQAGEHCRQVLAAIAADTGEAVFCGSSMGGWFARILQLHLHRQNSGIRSAAVAFNPAYDLCTHSDLLIGPQTNFVTGEQYTWTAAHSAGLQRLETAVNYDLPLPFFVFIDQGDEVIDWRHSAVRHANIAELTVYEGGCHSFDHFREALAVFEAEFIG